MIGKNIILRGGKRRGQEKGKNDGRRKTFENRKWQTEKMDII